MSTCNGMVFDLNGARALSVFRAARVLGADAVGMSTVPEAIAAAHCGYEILGVTLCANMAAGVLPQPCLLYTSPSPRDTR